MNIFQCFHRTAPPSPRFALVFLFLMLLVFRVYANIETLRMDYTDNVFRVGIVPWSDAKGWVDGALQLLDGESISGVSTARPLYPLFLSVLFFFLGSSYLGLIYAQMVLSALVIAAAYHLLKPVRNRLGVLIFLSFLAVWRPDVSTVFMTENLGIYLLILCFAFMWRGFSLYFKESTFSGAFLLGLSQAVRPWCVMTLVTTPFVSFCSSRPFKEKFRFFIIHALLIALGFGLHPVAAALFNKPGEGYANNPQTLYGQVVGGKGWTAVYNDPLIKKALAENRSAIEVNAIIYERIKQLLLENPGNFLKGIGNSYKHYFSKIPDQFGDANTTPIYFSLFFLLLCWLDCSAYRLQRNILLKNRFLAGSVLILSLVLFFMEYRWFWTIVSLMGILQLIVSHRNGFSAFLLLFLAGILLSLPLVGNDGGLRVRIGSDIAFFSVAAIGFSKLLTAIPSLTPGFRTPEPPSKSEIRSVHCTWIIFPTIALFLAIPFSIRLLYRHHAEFPTAAIQDAEEIAARLELEETPLTPEHLNALWYAWPGKSFEEVDGRLAFFPIRYTAQDAVSFDIREGISRMNPIIGARHWPLYPMDMKRTVMILENWYTLFPNVSLEALSRFQNKRMVVVGNLLVNRRPFMHATPFVLIASHILSTDHSGSLQVTKLAID